MTKKHGPSERTNQNHRKRAKQNGDSQPIRCKVQTLEIRMLRELTEYGKSVREEVKATLSEIKKNPQGTNSERKEARVQINNWNLGK